MTIKEIKDAPSGSIKEISKPDQVDICYIFHCDCLLLCVVKDISRLVVYGIHI